ncbi:MAG: hypothetical protein K0R10_2164 [Alphaproteobacteria bacterium]|jgi:hypothetical protein|nr:hypothetical protein [Alphaproteobacteria bacterium]
MAFKLTQKPTFVSRVTVETPNQKGGFDRSAFNVEFRRAGMDEIEELKKLPGKEVMEKVLVGWSELLDDDNQPVDFNDDNLRALLNIPPALLAMSAAFWESLFKAREKN